MPPLPHALLPALFTGLPHAIRPDPDQARSWVERELSRPEYHRGLLERFSSWLGDLWDGLTQAAAAGSPLSTAAAVAVVAVLAALALTVAGRVRREAPADRRGRHAVVGHGDSPDMHRRAAEQALENGDLRAALVEAFRALASRWARRALLEERPGLTAHEVATELGAVFSHRAGELAHAADVFDSVFYGDQPAHGDDARAVLRLDAELGRSTPDRAPDRPTAGAPR
jgi:hypothetical protein